MTAAGASLVFFYKRVGRVTFCLMTAGAAGIMLASTFFSLLLPAVQSEGEYSLAYLVVGFVLGGFLIVATDLFFRGKEGREKTGAGSHGTMCVAVSVHNIPEGLAIGVAFGALSQGSGAAALSAITLALGIGIQNFPEGVCVSFPLRAGGCSRAKSFFIGQLSGAVEIAAGVVGALAVALISDVLPFALAFSAGAMLAVVCSELIPECFEKSKIISTVGVVVGFTLMMLLDVAFG